MIKKIRKTEGAELPGDATALVKQMESEERTQDLDLRFFELEPRDDPRPLKGRIPDQSSARSRPRRSAAR